MEFKSFSMCLIKNLRLSERERDKKKKVANIKCATFKSIEVKHG